MTIAQIDKLALVVDDSTMQCKLLSILLREENYRVVMAHNGKEAVDAYIKHKPDLVLMDINMPIMDGYEAARAIKALAKGNLAPLIFITSMNTDQAFIDAVDAGGDGILVRPFSPAVFKAKIKSIQRISDLYSQIKQLQQAQQQDAELAEQLMSGVIESRNYGLDRINIIKKAATLFSGDIQLSALSPNGDIHVMLGDFTGHGLRSSIGAIPLAGTFRAMTKKGFSLFEIISQINQQLYTLLPKDLFLAAAFISISPHKKSVYIFNAGLPDIYTISVDGTIKNKNPSSHPPLGVIKTLLPESRLTVQAIDESDQIILFSDGIIEARNIEEKMYGIKRFEEVVTQKNTINIADNLMRDVLTFCHEMPQEDDLSIIQIPCGGWNIAEVNSKQKIEQAVISTNTNEQLAWNWSMYLAGRHLAELNPIPILMNYIQEIEGVGTHWQSVYTILTELYVNALDHGVLGLDSTLKLSPEGFVEYFNERQQRLNNLTQGYVNIEISYYVISEGSKLVIKIKDSGQGFNVAKRLADLYLENNLNALSGRGIKLIKEMTNDLRYSENGTLVEASILWH